jgi:DNA-directed RNA polymerase specialized sigma24 family protein
VEYPRNETRQTVFKAVCRVFYFRFASYRHGFENGKGKPCSGIAAYLSLFAACHWREPRAAAPRLSPFDFNPIQKSDGGRAMKNYQNSDYALNKKNTNIEYIFASAEHVPGSSSYSEADFLAEKPDRTAEDFVALKEFSDEDYHKQKLRDYNTTHLNWNIEWAEDKGLCYSQSPEEILIGRINAGEYARKRARQVALAQIALAAMTDIQRHRYILHIAYGLSTHEIAKCEGVNQSKIMKSLDQAEKKIKKILAEG